MAATLPGGINAEQGGRNGVFTLGSGAAGAGDPQFDQQMYLPMNAMWPQGAGSGGGTRGGGTGSGSGGYSSSGQRATAIAAAENQLADAEGDVLEKQAALAEVEADADAAESDKIRARNDRDKAIRYRDAARTELTVAQNTPVGDDTTSGQSGGPSGASFGQDMLSGLMEAIGLDGSVFSDPTQWGIWKLFIGGANYLGGLLKNFQTGGSPGRVMGPYGGAHRVVPNMAVVPGHPDLAIRATGAWGRSSWATAVASGVGGALMGALPQVGDYLPSAATQAAGPIDASITLQGNVDHRTFGQMRGFQHDRVRTAGSGMRGLGGGF